MIDNRFDVKDRVVLITGAGQGIGKAYAKSVCGNRRYLRDCGTEWR